MRVPITVALVVLAALGACGGETGLSTTEREALIALAGAIERGRDDPLASIEPRYQLAIQELESGALLGLTARAASSAMVVGGDRASEAREIIAALRAGDLREALRSRPRPLPQASTPDVLDENHRPIKRR